MIKLKNAKTTALIKVLACRKKTKEEIERSGKTDAPEFQILHEVIEVIKFEGEAIETPKKIKSSSYTELRPGEQPCEVKITKVNFDTYITILKTVGEKNANAK